MQLLIAGAFNAQRVFPLFEDLSVDSVLKPKAWASKISFDPISQHLFYTTSGGNIYEVFENTNAVKKQCLKFYKDKTLQRLKKFLCIKLFY